MKKIYPSDVSDEEWALLKPYFLPPGAPRKAGRVETPESVRACYNAIRYLLKTGCQWRMLPSEFPPKSTVHDAFTRWSASGLWPHINNALRPALRLKLKRNADPSAAIIDSQSVKCADTVGAGSSGFDAGKKIKGRKRHILTDTQGLLLGVHVGPASVQDRDGAKVLFCLFCHLFLSVILIFADGGYQGKLEAWVRQMGDFFGHRSLALKIIKRSDQAKGFQLLPRRWVVERTFGWLVKSRRLVRDHERKSSHHEAFVYLAMIGFAARRLTK